MGNSLWPVLENMSSQEESLIPNLNRKLKYWYRYVDDTFTIIKSNEIDNILQMLNNYQRQSLLMKLNKKIVWHF